jgi:hypothetical protein
MIKSRRLRRMRHVERKGRRKMHRMFWLVILKARDYSGNLDVVGNTILK